MNKPVSSQGFKICDVFPRNSTKQFKTPYMCTDHVQFSNHWVGQEFI